MTDFGESSALIELCWKYFVLGVVQGLTEFIPISSTAHLKVVPVLLGWEDPGVAAAAVIQLGSITAVIAYFWKDLSSVGKSIVFAFRYGQWRTPDAQLGFAIGIGTLPILIAGTFIKIFWPGYETSFLRNTFSIALVSIVMAILLAIAEREGSRWKNLKMVKGRDGLIVGMSQVLALVPGVSRSGVTLTTSMLDGWERKDAARFSFLLGIPAISIAGLVELKNALHAWSFSGWLPLLVGIISSAFVSWLAIDWILKYLQQKSAWLFVIYRLMFGLLLLLFWPIFHSK